MQDVLVCAGQRIRNLSTDEDWQEKVRLVLGRLSENERRWVAGLLAGAVGWGGETFAASVTGLDAKTVRTGRVELESELADCPADGIRRPGAGRPPVEKKIPASNGI
jgi:hypothetical protein